MNVRLHPERAPWTHGSVASILVSAGRKEKPFTQDSGPRPSQPAGRARSSRGTSCAIAAQRAFTLIELILVMVIITVAVSLAAPRLSAFFRGRALDSEARRLLALTRYAQDRAASEGVPVRLWLDPQNSEYGVSIDQSYEEEDASAQQFKIGDGITLQVQAAVKTSTREPITKRLTSKATPRTTRKQDNFQAIRFLPDGLIDSESMLSLSLTDADSYTLVVAPAKNRMHYEITRGASR